jgi:hypothetical protein
VSPLVKYSLARVGLLVVVAGVLLAVPLPVDPLVKLMLAFVLSLILSQVLLRRLWRPAALQVSAAAARRAQEKQRLRAALAGDEPPPTEPVASDTSADAQPTGESRPPGAA